MVKVNADDSAAALADDLSAAAVPLPLPLPGPEVATSPIKRRIVAGSWRVLSMIPQTGEEAVFQLLFDAASWLVASRS